MQLKSQLQSYLDSLGITASQLARKSGVSKQVLSQWLAGVSPRNIAQVKQVANALGTTVDELCFGEGKKVSKDTSFNIPEDDWISGIFELKLRRVKKSEDK